MQISINDLEMLGGEITTQLRECKEPFDLFNIAITHLEGIISGQKTLTGARAKERFLHFLSTVSKESLNSVHFKNKDVSAL